MAKSIKRQQIENLEAENGALRERLGLVLDAADIDAWESTVAQTVRDEMAVRALFMHSGDMYSALIFMGFRVPLAGAPRRAMAARVFNTQGVRDLIARDCSDLEKQRAEIIGRTMRIAMFGADKDSIAATQVLARIGGWQKQPEGGGHAGAVNVNFLLNGRPQLPTDAPLPVGSSSASLLGHEPGAAVRVYSEAEETKA